MSQTRSSFEEKDNERLDFHPEAGGMAIVVVGYPKSGNTWITRLVADVVGCPVAGYWAAPKHKELAIEGTERRSPHRVYKSHHIARTFVDLPCNHRVIYLLRDPRDVAVSGAHYFGVKEFWEDNPGLRHFSKYEAMVHNMMHGFGSGPLGKPWLKHVNEFVALARHPAKQSGPLIVKYEDVAEKPVAELTRVVDYLNLDRSIEQIQKSIQNQSFAVIKAREEEKGAAGRPGFFRKGKVGSFREELEDSLIESIETAYSDVMKKFGYELTTKAN